MSQNPLLEAKRLIKLFKSRGGGYLKAVDNVSFKIPGERATITSLVGESGSGKTTTGLIVLGILKPTSGEVRYEGKNINKMSRNEWFRYRSKVQAIFQDPYEVYNPFYKIDRSLHIPIKKFKLASSNDEVHKMILEALENVNLTPEEVLGKYPHQLSGGQRQRIMIARALLTRPELIVADEPVSMVDASLRAGILNTMMNLKRKYNISFLFITHDLSIADYFSDNIITLYQGSIVESGEKEAVLRKPAHPYLQMLIDSIPIPDPEKRWSKKLLFKIESLTQREDLGCKYYNRCPQAMEICVNKRPEIIPLEKNHFVACHLYSK